MQHLHNISTLEALRSMAKEIVLLLPQYRVILLKGELGAGKTTLVQMIAQLLGIKEPVTSPTYTLVNEYDLTHQGKMYHFDLYRLQKQEELDGIGFMEYIDSCLPPDSYREGKAGNICLIEWPEMAASYLADLPTLEITIHKSEKGRELEIHYHTQIA